MRAASRLRMRSPAASAPFDALSVAGAVRYYDMSLQTGYANNDAMGSWHDFSPAASDGAQAVVARKPTYKTNVQNGLPTARFDVDSTGDQIELASLAALTAAHVFVVVKVDLDPPSDTGKATLWNMGTGATHYYPYTDGVIYECFGSTVRKTVGNPAANLAAFNVYEVESAAGAWTCRLNGTVLYTTASNIVAFPAVPTIGGYVSIGTMGYIGAWLLFDHALSAPDAAYIRAGLKARWATP